MCKILSGKTKLVDKLKPTLNKNLLEIHDLNNYS